MILEAAGEIAPRADHDQQVGGETLPLTGVGASGGIGAHLAGDQVSRIGSQVGELSNEVVENQFAILIGEGRSKTASVSDGGGKHIK